MIIISQPFQSLYVKCGSKDERINGQTYENWETRKTWFIQGIKMIYYKRTNEIYISFSSITDINNILMVTKGNIYSNLLYDIYKVLSNKWVASSRWFLVVLDRRSVNILLKRKYDGCHLKQLHRTGCPLIQVVPQAGSTAVSNINDQWHCIRQLWNPPSMFCATIHFITFLVCDFPVMSPACCSPGKTY